jgi:hypothetical protein
VQAIALSETLDFLELSTSVETYGRNVRGEIVNWQPTSCVHFWNGGEAGIETVWIATGTYMDRQSK